ncbi:MAG: baseplate J/gp47 family protein [Hormoscilla sp. GUM202]|nr:baseplate J/gp47 family protein [Hormoscilla sp. GUM202]
MAVQPPKIDKRTEAEIVNQTVALAQYYTSWVQPTPEALRDRILVSDIVKDDGTTIATAGTLVDATLAVTISEMVTEPIRVKGWNTHEDTPQPDAGLALINIFGRMASQVSDRLNQSLNKNLLAFLNLIGTQMQPPRAARVPLTFYLATGSTGALVPAGTQVAAQPREGEEEEVIFETERNLTMTSAQLQAVFVREPEHDRYSDRTSRATGKEDEAFLAFGDKRQKEHSLYEHSFYIARDDLFTLAAPKKATLTINSTNWEGLAALPITWSYWDGTVWQPLLGIIEGLTVVVDPGQDRVRVLPGKAVNSEGKQIHLTQEQPIYLSGRRDETRIIVISANSISPKVEAVSATSAAHPAHTHIRLAYITIDSEGVISKSLPAETGSQAPWILSLNKFPVPTKKIINDEKNAAWLKAQLLNTVLPPNKTLPKINNIKVRVECDRSDIAPDLCLENTTTLDISKDFYPFGERPRFNETFYIASKDVFSKAGKTVHVDLTLSKELPINTDGGAQVLWEAWDGTTWRVVKQNTAGVNAANFTASGEVTLTLPGNMAPSEVNGESNYWIRARLVQGSYGTDTAYGNATRFTTLSEQRNKDSNTLKVSSVRGFMPGDRIDIALGSDQQESQEISAVNTSNNQITLKNSLTHSHPQGTSVFQHDSELLAPPSVKSLKLGYDYKSGDRALDACYTYNNFTYVDRTTAASSSTAEGFPPFTSTAERSPALYLGFDRPLANQLTTLYLQVAPPLPGEVTGRETVRKPAKVVWEYASPDGWQLLEVLDETETFSDRGLIEFIGPTDFSSRSEFGQQLYWLRGRWESGQFQIQPRLQQILTNTTWASQTTTLSQEILGSSDGNPNQTFFTSQSPVLKGQGLQVREQNVPSLPEKIAIEELEGYDAITVIPDDAGLPLEVWVYWHEVPDFYGSGPRDRHYVLDRLTGEVRFGDGQYGMVPPIGRSNIRMAFYRTGGGKRGNREAKTIAQLNTTIPYVDSVTNLEGASGGAEREALDRVQERGPKTLRHRHRAVTAEDIEDLAFEASAEVARALAITPHFSYTGLLWLPTYNLTLDALGDITVTVKVLDPVGEQQFDVIVSGPGRGVPYHRQRITCDRDNPPKAPQVTYSVSAADFALGKEWKVYLTTGSKDGVSGEITIQYPGGSINNDRFRDLTANPYPTVKDAGQVSVIIVPDSDTIPPTPSLGLVNRVEAYLQERCAATLTELQVTEPDWVEVTVTVTVVPISFGLADRARTAVKNALSSFLHPITGGPDGRGWAFGRQPHRSDLYSLLEGIPEVDRVATLSVVSKEVANDQTISQLTETQLIFSGNHQVILTY